jgi:hypothetical protein
MSVNLGAAAHLDLAYGSVADGSGRWQIRGVVQPTPPDGAGVLPPVPATLGCYVAPTLEIFENATGATTVILETAKSVPTILPLMGGGTTAPMP